MRKKVDRDKIEQLIENELEKQDEGSSVLDTAPKAEAAVQPSPAAETPAAPATLDTEMATVAAEVDRDVEVSVADRETQTSPEPPTGVQSREKTPPGPALPTLPQGWAPVKTVETEDKQENTLITWLVHS